MSILTQSRAMVRRLFRRTQVERELHGELHAFVEMLVEEKIEQGLSDAEARRQAQMELGGMEQVKEQVRDVWIGASLESIWQDICYGVRMLRKNPGFALTAVVTLALGIGANTAIYSMIYAALLAPLPYQDSESLVIVLEHNRKSNNTENPVSPANFFDWRDRNGVFEAMGAYHGRSWTFKAGDVPERVSGIRVAGDFFRVFRMDTYLGQVFTPEQAVKDDRKVVLSYDFWMSRLGGDAGLIGKPIVLDGKSMTVTGILSPGSAFPPGADLWVPRTYSETGLGWRGRHLTAVARLKPGIPLPQARAQMDTIAQQLEREHPDFNTEYGINIIPLHAAFSGSVRGTLLFLLGAVGVVLLIACANVGNLLLSRLAARERELAIRRALGAGNLRLTRQLLTESLLLASMGGLLGVLFAWWGVGIMSVILPGGIRSLFHVGVNTPVLWFTLGVSLLAGVLFGLAPSLQPARFNLQTSLKGGARGATAGRYWLRNALVTSEVALSLVLLVGAGLTVRSLVRLLEVETGFNPENVLAFTVALPNPLGGELSEKASGQAAFFEEALERINSRPDVESAGAVNFLPVASWAAGDAFYRADRPQAPRAEWPATDVVAVAGHYFQTMQIPLQRGRHFGPQDSFGSPPVVIINQTMASKHFTGENPLGKRVIMEWGKRLLDAEIIGVVGDVLQRGLKSEPRPTLYWWEPQFTFGWMNIVVRSRAERSGLTTALRKVIAELNPNLPAYSFRSMEQVVSNSVSRPRTVINLLGFFSLLALVLAVVGLYGVVSYWVGQRTQELGIRVALGARGREIFRLVVGRGVMLAGLGVVVGLAGAYVLSHLLELNLFEVEKTDPLIYFLVSALLLGTTLIACMVPAYRATKVNPTTALRYE